MNTHEYSLLVDLLHRPTAPFREAHVVRYVIDALRRAKVPFFLDAVGNIVVGAASEVEYTRLLRDSTREPMRVFVAHMDHPGFHGNRWLSDTRLRVTWYGGAPTRGLDGTRVWLADNNGYAALGRMRRPTFDKKHKRLVSAEISVDKSTWTSRPAAKELFGAFADRAPVWREGKLIYTKAADDLVGVFAIVRTAIKLLGGNKKKRPPFIGLLTRAEEVGFIGMMTHLEQGYLTNAKRRVICVSLETSRTLPGADIGKGPVVRLGDRRTVFDPNFLRVLIETAERALPKKHQRRIMDGGTCEATAALAYGLPAIGLSVPLGNYHNESHDGKQRGKPAPEYVHLDDVEGLLTLCEALLRPGLPWDAPWTNTHRGLRRNLRRYWRLLKYT